MKKIVATGSDFSGVGAFDYAITRVAKEKGFKHQRVYACDWDKYARITYAHNHGEPDYYPKDVYDRDIPKESLDVYMTSPPCQAFSIAGKRKGKKDKRGTLFFNSHEFIQVNKPRYFIFENVKGLLSDDGGKTFGEWIRLLGGKSVNGQPVIFSDEDSVPYHVYWKVINAKDHGIPQNRERVFIIGIRDDKDNNFRWPKEEHLTIKLKDVLETVIDEKYFLSATDISGLLAHKERNKENGNGFGVNISTGEEISHTIKSRYYKDGSDQLLKIGTWRTHKDGQGFREIQDGNCPTIPARAREDGSGQPVIEMDVSNCVTPDAYLATGKRKRDKDGKAILTSMHERRIRRLTPRECFRLMDFPEEFDLSVVSDTQAYKQAGNSIVVRVLQKILMKFNF